MDVVVKQLTSDLIRLERIKAKYEAKADSSLFLSAYYSRKKEAARRAFWTAVRVQWPIEAEMDATLRYDDTIVFKPYKVD